MVVRAWDLGVRLIGFGALLAHGPAKKVVPDFLTELPDSSAIVSWRIDTNWGNTLFIGMDQVAGVNSNG